MSRLMRVLAALFALSLIAASCGDDDDADTTTDTEETTADTEEETSTTSTTAGDTGSDTGGQGYSASETDLGMILVDAEGWTMYVFDNDSGGESSCYADCASNWPPSIVDGEPTGGEGVDASLLGTTMREDGSMQAMYNDRPLYRFAGDSGPGDTNGQSVGGIWWVIGVDGEAIET